MDKIALLVDEREVILDEQDIDIIKSIISRKLSANKECFKYKEGYWFEVNPLGINQELFQEKRTDTRQERTRSVILEAFEELKCNPKKYGRTFETLIPEKKELENPNAQDLINQANEIGDHIADWVEQALEWAQRISNGESWEAVCNEPDNCRYFRLVKWYNDKVQFIGGALVHNLNWSATNINFFFVKSCSYWFEHAVPLIVRYK